MSAEGYQPSYDMIEIKLSLVDDRGRVVHNATTMRINADMVQNARDAKTFGALLAEIAIDMGIAAQILANSDIFKMYLWGVYKLPNDREGLSNLQSTLRSPDDDDLCSAFIETINNAVIARREAMQRE